MDHQPTTRPERRRLSHVDRSGRPRMVDVSAKPDTARRAVAEALVALSQETLSLVIDGRNAKGDVLTVAELAGVMGAKRTSDLIPLCHPIPLTHVDVAIRLRGRDAAVVTCSARCVGQTGVEMEAMTGACVAALTLYDMCKALDRGIVVESVRLIEKSGGKSGPYRR